MGNFGKVRTSLGKLGQVRTRQLTRKMGKRGRKNKKREQKFSGNKKEEEKVGSRIRRNFRRINNIRRTYWVVFTKFDLWVELHEKTRSYECGICGKAFNWGCLKRHIDLAHYSQPKKELCVKNRSLLGIWRNILSRYTEVQRNVNVIHVKKLLVTHALF